MNNHFFSSNYNFDNPRRHRNFFYRSSKKGSAVFKNARADRQRATGQNAAKNDHINNCSYRKEKVCNLFRSHPTSSLDLRIFNKITTYLLLAQKRHRVTGPNAAQNDHKKKLYYIYDTYCALSTPRFFFRRFTDIS